MTDNDEAMTATTATAADEPAAEVVPESDVAVEVAEEPKPSLLDSLQGRVFALSSSPHVRADASTRAIMLDVVIALFFPLVWAVYVFGWRAASVTVVSVAACVAAELCYELIMRKPVTVGDLSAVVSGILLAMNLPVSIPLWMPVFGAVFAMVIVKALFGGVGKTIVNPALSARIFMSLSWPAAFIGSAYTTAFSHLPVFANISQAALDTVSSATPLASLKTGAIPSDATLIDLLLGTHSGAIGEVSAALLLAGGVYLLVRRVITWHIPVAFIGTVAALTYLFPRGDAGNTEFMAYQLLSGGLLLGAIFMATDYATSPIEWRGKLIFGVGCGLLTVLIRYFGGYPEGVSYAILIMNLFVWQIDKFTKPVRFGGAGSVKKKKA